jgi:predicted house-cleaning noncanonical NTP pyrophosphatase (MazG superfamily)
MSDFESTATAAVTKLQEIDELVSASTSQFEVAEQRLDELDTEITETSIAIMGSIDQVLQGISSAKSKQVATVDSLKQQVKATLEAASKAQEGGEKEVSEIQEKIAELKGTADEVQEGIKNQLQTMMSAVSDLKAGMDSVRDTIPEVTNATTIKVKVARDEAEQFNNALKQKAENVLEFVEQELQEGVAKQVNHMTERLDEMKSEFETRLENVKDEFTTASQETMDQAKSEQETQLEAIKAAVEQMSEHLKATLGTIKSTSDSMMTVKDTMNTCVKSTNVGMQAAVETLTNIKEIFEKIV